VATLSDQFAEFLLGTKGADIPEADLEACAQSVYDAIGTGLAGRGSPHGKIVEQYVLSQGSVEEATIIGSDKRAPAPLAGLANGVFVHADDFDDMGAYGHPSAPLVPALLAASEMAGLDSISGEEFVVAYALGFETAMTLYADGKYDQYDACFHSTPVFGAVGSAGALSRLLGLSHDETVAAIAIAASPAGGLGRNNGTMVKPLHAGFSASAAISAVQLAQAGVRGATDVLEGRGGFAETFFRHRAMQPARVANAIGNPYKAASHLHVKVFPCCGSNQSALHAVRELVAMEGISYDQIDECVVEQMADTSPVLRYPSPVRGLNGKFSIHYTVGNLLLKGKLKIDDFTDAETQKPEVKEAVAKVKAEVLSRWDKRAGADRKAQGNPVRITTKDGKVYHHAIQRSLMLGSPKNRMTWDELTVKFDDNAARELNGAPAISEASRLWRNLREQPTLSPAFASITTNATEA
jgi:2-methylcitrate dehydratase PrpD